MCTLEASRLNSRAMRPRCVKSWLWSGSSAHTLRVVSRRCRCSIRLLSSWGRGPSSWRGEGTRTALHHSLSRCRQPFSPCFPIPHDSAPPSDPSSAQGHSPVIQVPCLGLTHRARPGIPGPLAGLRVLEPPSSHTLGLAECLWVNHSSTGPQNPHLLHVHIPFLPFYPTGFLCR